MFGTVSERPSEGDCVEMVGAKVEKERLVAAAIEETAVQAWTADGC